MGVEKLISSEFYEGLLFDVVRDNKIKIIKNNDFLNSLDQGYIDKSKVNLNDLLSTIADNKSIFMKFCFFKINGLKSSQDQDFPINEENDLIERDVLIEVKGKSEGFLILYMIEFYFIFHDLNKEFVDYLSLAKIPGTKKYAAELRCIYNAAKN